MIHKNISYGASFDDALTVVFNYLTKARSKNIIQIKTPIIIDVQEFQGDIDTTMLSPLSSVFVYSKNDDTSKNMLRVQVLRLLSGMMKSWFFQRKDLSMYCEPCVGFSIDENGLLSPYIIARYGKQYVCVANKTHLNHQSFPTVISADSYKWFTQKKWKKCQEDSLLFEIFLEKQSLNYHDGCQLLTTVKKEDELLQYAHIIDIPFALKDKMKLTGVLWNPHVKKWFLPFGWDHDCVLEYLDYIKKEA